VHDNQGVALDAVNRREEKAHLKPPRIWAGPFRPGETSIPGAGREVKN
jgi:hypothetical protein